jgi:hypothetical protein
MDHEVFDISCLRSELHLFHKRMEALFLQGSCLEHGHTKAALDYLQRARVLEVPGQGLKTLGSARAGAAHDAVLRAQARMTNWVKVMQEISATEFPDYDLLAQFSVFSIKPQRSPGLDSAERAALSHIAHALGANLEALTRQTEEHKRIAEHEMRAQPSLTSVVAWERALRRTQADAKRRQRYPADVLRPVLQFYAVASGTTSGIEQNFSVAKRNLGEQWAGSPLAEERRLCLTLARRAAKPTTTELSRLLEAARHVWAATFGPPRVSGQARQCGVGQSLAAKRRRATTPRRAKSHAAWLRRRREAARQLEAAADGNAANGSKAVAALAEAQWTKQHQAEVDRQRSVRADRERDAAACGLAAYEGPDLNAKVAEERTKENRRQQTLAALHRRAAAVRSRPVVADIKGKNVWVHPNALDTMATSQSAWWTPQSLRVVASLHLADVLVVPDAAQPGGRTRTLAALRGCLVVTPDFFLSPPGVAVQWKADLQLQRTVYFSEGVRAAHTAMVDLILLALKGQSESRWRVFLGDQWPEFQGVAAKKVAQKRGYELRSVLLATELRAPQFRSAANNNITLHDFLGSLGRLEVTASMLGMCRR